MGLEALQQRVEQLGGEDAYPVVPLDLFFEGNEDPASAPDVPAGHAVVTLFWD